MYYRSRVSLSGSTLYGKTDLQLLDDYGMYLDFESNIRGGLVTATKRHITCNTPEMGEDYDSSEDTIDQTIVMGDWNSMYPAILKRSMPYGNIEYILDIEPFKNEKFLMSIDTSDSATVDYFLIVDIWIPEFLKKSEIQISTIKK